VRELCESEIRKKQLMGWAIALHGGAGDIPYSLPPERRQPREEALRHCLQIGVKALKSNMAPLDVVELVVCIHSQYNIELCDFLILILSV